MFIWTLSQPPTSWVTLEIVLTFPGPQSSHLQNGWQRNLGHYLQLFKTLLKAGGKKKKNLTSLCFPKGDSFLFNPENTKSPHSRPAQVAATRCLGVGKELQRPVPRTHPNPQSNWTDAKGGFFQTAFHFPFPCQDLYLYLCVLKARWVGGGEEECWVIND